MINVSSYRKMDNQLDVLGNTTWGIRKVLFCELVKCGKCTDYPFSLQQMALDVLNWAKENREDVNFVLESKLLFSPTSSGSDAGNWRRGWTMKMSAVSALLVTLGKNSTEPPSEEAALANGGNGLQFPRDTGVAHAALLLVREKNSRYSMVRVSVKETRS